MQSPGTRAPEDRDLRRYLRDLAAVTALPAVWSGAERRHIAGGMAEVSVTTLQLDFAYVRLEGSTSAEPLQAVHFAKAPAAPVSAAEIGGALDPHIPIVSGNIVGQTQTLPLLVEERFRNFDSVGAYSAGFALALISMFIVAAMTVHEVSRILTFNTGDFARYGIEVIHPSAVS